MFYFLIFVKLLWPHKFFDCCVSFLTNGCPLSVSVASSLRAQTTICSDLSRIILYVQRFHQEGCRCKLALPGVPLRTRRSSQAICQSRGIRDRRPLVGRGGGWGVSGRHGRIDANVLVSRGLSVNRGREAPAGFYLPVGTVL